MNKAKRYERIQQQITELIEKVQEPVSRMATITALLHHKMPDFFWTGFYLLRNGELLVGPYQGPVACLKLNKNTGVCWAGINRQESVVVADVEEFPGHIACSSLSKSEIVVPIFNQQREIVGVLDVDSKSLNTFDETDRIQLEKIVHLIHHA
jgi:GAF domain-containing protein